MEPSLPTELNQKNIKRSPASRKACTRFCLLGASALLIAGFASVSFAGIKKVPYPEIKVTIDTAYLPDAAFEKMRTAFVDAVAKKDVQALSDLVAPTFLWTIGGWPSDELDLGRDAIHNFKVVFGFRAPGEDADGIVGDGPYWDALAALAGDRSYYAATDSGNLVCGPIAAYVANNDLFEQARKKIETGGEEADWYFSVGNTEVMKAPGDTGAPIGKVGTVALPILGFYPSPQEGKPVPQFTHVEVLLSSGRSGWIPVAAVRPLFTDHLCYAKIPSGDWKIAAIDQPEH
jgi:hypothetical protein